MKHIYIRAILLEVWRNLYGMFDLNGIEKKNIVKYSYPSGIKNCEI
jgi:hypothetical protein